VGENDGDRRGGGGGWGGVGDGGRCAKMKGGDMEEYVGRGRDKVAGIRRETL